MTPRLAWLYLRSRPVAVPLVAVAALGAMLWVVFDAKDDALTVAGVVVVAPFLSALGIAAGVRSPFGDAETAAGTHIPLLRAGLLAALLALATAFFMLIGGMAAVPATNWALVRNLAGYAGLGFLAGRVLGFGNGWVVPFAAMLITLLTNLTASGTPDWWALPAFAGGHDGAAFAALALLFVGFAALVRETRPRWLLVASGHE